jgi:hypothetical protein
MLAVHTSAAPVLLVVSLLLLHSRTEDKSDDTKDNFCEDLERLFR